MKKTLLVFIWALLFHHLQAQLRPGDLFTGGSLSVNVQDASPKAILLNGNGTTVQLSEKRHNWRLAPAFGWGLSDRWAVGLGIVIQGSGSKQRDLLSSFFPPPEIRITTRELGLSPFVRYYTPLSGKAGILFDLNPQVSFGRERIETNNRNLEVRNDLFGLSASLYPAVYYFISERFCLEASLGGLLYNYRSTNPGNDFESSSTTRNFGLSVSNFPSFSFRYFLKRGTT